MMRLLINVAMGVEAHVITLVQRELQRVVVKDVEELRTEELAILDRLHSECWVVAMDKSNKSRLFAVDRLLAISEARRKLMGLDASTDSTLNAGMVVVREIPQGYMPAVEAPKE